MRKILVIDDHASVQESIADLLGGDYQLAFAADARAMRAQLQTARFDLAILDLNFPAPYSGIDLLPELTRLDIKVIAYTGNWNAANLQACIDGGVTGFCDKADKRRQLVKSVRQVLDGKRSLPDEIRQRAVARNAGSAVDIMPLPTLAVGQKQVLSLLCLQEGISNAELAASLGYAEATVKKYIVQLHKKFHVSCRRDLTQAALCAGFKPQWPQAALLRHEQRYPRR